MPQLWCLTVQDDLRVASIDCNEEQYHEYSYLSITELAVLISLVLLDRNFFGLGHVR